MEDGDVNAVMVDGKEKLAMRVILSDDEEHNKEWIKAEFRPTLRVKQYIWGGVSLGNLSKALSYLYPPHSPMGVYPWRYTYFGNQTWHTSSFRAHAYDRRQRLLSSVWIMHGMLETHRPVNLMTQTLPFFPVRLA
jgi:hypothetical protein